VFALAKQLTVQLAYSEQDIFHSWCNDGMTAFTPNYRELKSFEEILASSPCSPLGLVIFVTAVAITIILHDKHAMAKRKKNMEIMTQAKGILEAHPMQIVHGHMDRHLKLIGHRVFRNTYAEMALSTKLQAFAVIIGVAIEGLLDDIGDTFTDCEFLLNLHLYPDENACVTRSEPNQGAVGALIFFIISMLVLLPFIFINWLLVHYHIVEEEEEGSDSEGEDAAQADLSDPLEAEQIEMANLQKLNAELSKPSGDSSCSHAEEPLVMSEKAVQDMRMRHQVLMDAMKTVKEHEAILQAELNKCELVLQEHNNADEEKTDNDVLNAMLVETAAPSNASAEVVDVPTMGDAENRTVVSI